MQLLQLFLHIRLQVNEAFDLVRSGKARYRVVLDMDASADPALLCE
jgi:hypothetical protein